MKKLLILAGAIVFLAAACNSSNQPTVQNTPQPKTAGAKIDAAVDALNRSVDVENAVNMQSDSDIVNSDQTVINGYSGATNAISY